MVAEMLDRFNIVMAQDVKEHTAGTGSGYLVDDASLSKGDTTITVDTGSGTILAGDVVTIASQKYVVATALSGSTFTITSLGKLGGVLATPIINFPEVGILGVHKIAERPAVEEEALRSYGLNLGIAFQLVDDVLDYSALQARLGKTVGDDFREGKITLPVVLAFRRGTEEERGFWKRCLEEMDQQDGDLDRALGLMARHNTLADTVERARHYAAVARDALALFPDRPEKAALLDVLDFVVEREF